MADVEEGRQMMAEAIRTGTDIHPGFNTVVFASASFSEKFRVLNFCDLLQKNSESADGVKRLLYGLNILEKYGRHLLKPAENRSSMWRHIKYSNNIFRERISTIKGGTDIMTLMGYTENKADGVAFPEGAEPVHGRVLDLVIDIYQGRKELELFLDKRHPQPDSVILYLSPVLRSLLENEEQAQSQPAPQISHETPQSLNPAALSGSTAQQQHQSQQNYNPHVNVGSYSMQPDLVGASHQQQSHSAGKDLQYVQYAKPVRPKIAQQPPVNQQQQYQPNQLENICQHQIPNNQPESALHHSQMPNSQSELALHPSQNVPALFDPANQSRNTGSPHSQLDPSSYQAQTAELPTPAMVESSSQQTQIKQLDHLGARSKTGPDYVKVDVTSPAGDGKGRIEIKSAYCDICNEEAYMLCNLCDVNKKLCRSCNEKWHTHPKRRNHQQTSIQGGQAGNGIDLGTGMSPAPVNLPPATNFPPAPYLLATPNQQQQHRSENPDEVQYRQPVAGIAVSTPSPRGSREDFMNYDPRNSQPDPLYMQKSNPYNTAAYSPPYVSTQIGMAGEPGSHMPSSFMYGQPMGQQMGGQVSQQIHGGMSPYHGSVMPHGQQVTYGPAPGQFPMGYIPAAAVGPVFMPPQLSMQSGYMGLPATSVDTGHNRPGIHQSLSEGTLQRPSNTATNHPYHPDLSTANIRQSISSPKVSEYSGMSSSSLSNTPPSSGRPSTPSSGRSSTPSTSSLLPKIKMIPDLDRRLSRLDIYLMDLQDDKQDMEDKLNDIMIENPDYLTDETYQSIGRKKRKHLQEIRHLENYKSVLTKELKETAEKTNNVPREPALAEIDDLIKKFKDKGVNDQEARKSMSQVLTQMQSSPPTGPPNTTAHRMVKNKPDENQYFQMQAGNQPPVVSSIQSQRREADTPPNLGLESLRGDNMDEIKKLLVLDQNPFATRPSNVANNVAPQTSSNMNMMNVIDQVAYPPDIDKTLPPKSQYNQIGADVNLAQKEISQNLQNMKIADNLQEAKWACEHCTFQNDVSSKACEVCFKTSDKKVIIGPIGSSKAKPAADVKAPEITAERDESVECCEHCTFANPIGSTVCSICGKSQSKYHVQECAMPSYLEDNTVVSNPAVAEAYPAVVDPNPGMMGTNQELPARVATGDASTGLETQEPVLDTSSVGKLIDAEQDKVYREKIEAQKRYQDGGGDDKQPLHDARARSKSHATAGSGDSANVLGNGELVLEPALPTSHKPRANSAAPSTETGLKPDHLIPAKHKNVEMARNIQKSPNSTGSSSDIFLSANSSLENEVKVTDPHGDVKVKSSMSSTNVPTPNLGSQTPSQLVPSMELGARPKVSGLIPGLGSKVAGSRPTQGSQPTGPGTGIGSGEGVGPTAAPKAAKPELSFAETIEKINVRKEQQQMSLDGHEILNLIKETESAGFSIQETNIALRLSVESKMNPRDWLNDTWDSMVSMVVNSVAETAKAAQHNDIGDLSRQEAREALVESDADINKAIEMCVQQRQHKFAEVCEFGEFAREDILTALLQNHGQVVEVIDQLNDALLQNYSERIWNGENDAAGGTNEALLFAAANTLGTESVANSVIGHQEFQALVSDKAIDRERRVRMVFVEARLRSWGRADVVISILENDMVDEDDPLECTLEDVVEAVRNCGDRRSSLVYLRQECGACFTNYPMSKIRNLTCDCKLCEVCLKLNFEVVIKERHIRNWCCPLCEQPGLEDEVSATEYFEFLSLLLNNLVSKEIKDLFETKLRDWHLQKDPNFRWCAHCVQGFIWDQPNRLDMMCPNCHRKTCFECKKIWEDQHQGLTCEEFTEWKINNDPETQTKGVQRYLEENGIDCPSCKMRYSLAKGGCMHFKCPQCGYEFCSGCSQAFVKQECKVLRSCKDKGLHCHHPRDCFYYLRDNDVDELQTLLKKSHVKYNMEVSDAQEDKNHCPVMEQKEVASQKRDESCGKDTQPGMAGLCEPHYKEYLVGLINKHKIDPLPVMATQDMLVLIQRNEKEVPKRNQNENDEKYKKRVMQFIKERWRLHR